MKLPECVLSALAENDLDDIGDYTLNMWGERQAIAYIDGIYHLCQSLVEAPRMGREYGLSKPGLRRIEYQKHVIFYREIKEGIRVTRILHQSMLPFLHVLDDEA